MSKNDNTKISLKMLNPKILEAKNNKQLYCNSLMIKIVCTKTAEDVWLDLYEKQVGRLNLSCIMLFALTKQNQNVTKLYKFKTRYQLTKCIMIYKFTNPLVEWLHI